MLQLSGDPDGRVAFDYTINAATGYPGVTGPAGEEAPSNHVLPAWDLLAGAHAGRRSWPRSATAGSRGGQLIVCALRRRARDGRATWGTSLRRR